MWRHIRGFLVALHIIAVVLVALPPPAAVLNRAAWKNPTVQDELATWTKRLNAWGVATSQQALEEQLWQISHTYISVRDKVSQPFQPYYDCCGTRQGWQMFVAPHRYPTALHIDVAKRGVWKPVYVQRDHRHAWRRRQFDSYRFRSSVFRFGWPGYETEYERFSHWVARQAAHDFGETDQVRVRLYKYRTPAPQEVSAGLAPSGKFVQTIVQPLGVAP